MEIVKSCCIEGLEVYPINVEVDLDLGLPVVLIVGLPTVSVKESKDRVRSAIKNLDYEFPMKRITVNLAPAFNRKEGSHFDLPIALGILQGSGQIPPLLEDDTVVIGELSLDGGINGVTGILPMLLEMKNRGYKKALIPHRNLPEGGNVNGMEVLGFKNLSSVITYIVDGEIRDEQRAIPSNPSVHTDLPLPNYAEIKGQESLKRGMVIAAAGLHNVLMIGPPGSGKSMAAKRIPSILPPLSAKKSIEVTKIYSISGKLFDETGLLLQPPFRSPHNTSTAVSLSGGGLRPMPGEISLAHHGVLFLDELPEFDKRALEILRQPLEDHKITLSRSHRSYTYPADFLFVAAMNPCPCGYYGDPVKECTCSAPEILRYQQKLSGPLLDRIDLIIEVPRGSFSDLQDSTMKDGLSSETMAKDVLKGRTLQAHRYQEYPFEVNSRIPPHLNDEILRLDDNSRHLLEKAYDQMKFTPRSYHKLLKVSRTIADLEETPKIEERHILEALQYRNFAYQP